MHKYIAFLRAINVGGRTIIKMTDLKQRFKSFGLDHVQTYIQTGNVVFEQFDNDQKTCRKIRLASRFCNIALQSSLTV